MHAQSEQNHERPIRRMARLAGVLYLGMGPFAIYSLTLRFGIFEAGDAAATVRNLMAAGFESRLAILSQLVSQTLFILLALTLYRVFRPVSAGAATLMVALALVGIPVAFVNELNQIAALRLVAPEGYFATQPPEQIQMLVMLFLQLHHYGLLLCHLTWGLWLLPLGYLVARCGVLPRWLGWLLVAAGVGYLVDLVLGVVWPERTLVVTPYTFIGELMFAGWLMLRGIGTGNNRYPVPASALHS